MSLEEILLCGVVEVEVPVADVEDGEDAWEEDPARHIDLGDGVDFSSHWSRRRAQVARPVLGAAGQAVVELGATRVRRCNQAT